jgi:hypothetical protein
MIGNEEKAKKVLNNILDASDKGFVPPTQLAIVYCGLKDYDKALDQIEQAFLIHDIWLVWIKYLDFAGPLKNDPRFIDLMKQYDFN